MIQRSYTHLIGLLLAAVYPATAPQAFGQIITSQTGPKWILTIHGTAGWEYTLLKYGSFTNIHGIHYDYLPWHTYLAETNGSVDVIDLTSGPQLIRYASRSRRVWISGEPFQQPEMTGRQRFVLSAECHTNFTYQVLTNSSLEGVESKAWVTYQPATNGTIRLIDENYKNAVPWLEGTAENKKFYYFGTSPSEAASR